MTGGQAVPTFSSVTYGIPTSNIYVFEVFLIGAPAIKADSKGF
jgi:hypothetical protein